MNEEEKEIAKLLLEGIKGKGKDTNSERTQGIHDYNTFIGACHRRATIEREARS